MKSFTKRFANETEFVSKLHDTWGNFTDEVRGAVGHLEAGYRESKRRGIIGGLIFAGGVLALILLDNGLPVLSWLFAGPWFVSLAITVVLLAVLIYAGRAIYVAVQKHREFSRALDGVIFPFVLEQFGLEATHVEIDDATKKADILELLNHSELITESRNTLHYDDAFHTTVFGWPAFCAELHAQHVTGSGKNRRVREVFKGVFVMIELPRTLTGKTFVSSEGDKRGFGHKSFWNGLRGRGAEETELEWNDFENKLHVAATNPTEARYILTPDFMERLYEWWKLKHSNIRIAFLENRMYILFPDKAISLQGTVPQLDTHSLKAYVTKIARPLVHVFHLLDVVETRFRS